MPRSRPTPDDIARTAREKLGFKDLRPGQYEAVQAILDGHDTLAVQPTGSGKSAIYQIAGLLIDGSTVVVSPLIALQKDQVDAIDQNGAAPAVAVNSSRRVSELREAFNQIEEGAIEYIFLAPEQLRKQETMERLSNANVSLFVVDEAHCISQWGHEFRPDYMEIGRAIEQLGHPRVLALTATASGEVRDEIVNRLAMRNPKIFVRGFDRPNIFLRVDRFEEENEKADTLIHRALWAERPGIVYAGTRKAAEDIVYRLRENKTEALFYHAGLGGKERESVHDRFMSGEAEIIVATNAFGMGVDKPDIRFVYHYDPPESLDAYYQEIGRAGRDGEKSEAILFYRDRNLTAQSYKTGEGRVDPHTLQMLLDRVAGKDEPAPLKDIAEEAGIATRKATLAVQRLEQAGAVEILPGGNVAVAEEIDIQEAIESVTERQEQRREAKRRQLREMRDYADSSRCRREILLQHLGDDFHGPCGFCDNCEASDGTRREVV